MKKMKLFSLAWPIFIETALFILLGMIDVLILSSYDDLAASAVGTANQTVSIVTIIFNIISTASAVMISQYLGAGKRESASQTAALSIALQLIFGILVSVIFLLFHQPLLMMIGADGQLLDFAGQYLLIVGGTIFLQAAMTAVSVIIRNHGLTKITMFVSAGMNLFNTALDLVLVPRMGVTGAAIATGVSRLIGCVVLVIILYTKIEKPAIFRMLIPFPFKQFGTMLKVGIPSAAETFLYNLSQLVITAIVLNFLTENELIAKTYAQSITMLFYLCSLAIGQASQIMIGHLVGAGRYDEAYRQGYRSHRTALLIMAAVCSVGILLREPLIGLFTDNPEIISICSDIILINCVLELGRTTNLVMIASMRGAGDVYFPTACAIFSNWFLSVLGSYLFAVVFGMGIYGLWIALAADECVRGILMLLRWKNGRWRTKRLIRPDSPKAENNATLPIQQKAS